MWRKIKLFSKLQVIGCFCQFENIHCCSIYLKKKEKFHNIYIQEYRPKVYTGFIEDRLDQLHKNTLFDIEDDAPDFEKSLIGEARHRRKMYKKKVYLKEMGVKLKPTMPKFTAEQMQQIKFLHSENPSVWTASYLATSFGVEIQVIKKILRSKIEDMFTNSSVSESSNFVKCDDNKSIMPASYQPLLHPTEERVSEFQPHQKEDLEVKENQWFSNFKLNGETDEFVEVDEMEEFEQLLEDETFLDEHDELFDIEQEENEIDDRIEDEEFEGDGNKDKLTDFSNSFDSADSENTDSINLTSTDNVNFYDGEGRFLFRLR